MGEVRKMMIICLLDALCKATTPSTVKNGFKAAGIVPVDRNVPLSSIYAIQNESQNIYNYASTGSINNKFINESNDSLLLVYILDYHHRPQDHEMIFQFSEIIEVVKYLHKSNDDGWALTDVPDLIVEIQRTSLKMHQCNK